MEKLWSSHRPVPTGSAPGCEGRRGARASLLATIVVLAAILGGAVVAVGCGDRDRRNSGREVDPSAVHVLADKLVLRSDKVGHDQWQSEATFVLADAKNLSAEDLMVTLGGDLLDDAGVVVGNLRSESLRIPAGGQRTFALVEFNNTKIAAAVSAHLRMEGAYVPNYPPGVIVEDGHAYKDGSRVVVTANIVNITDRTVKVIVVGGFYGQGDLPLQRPFTVFKLGAKAKHPAQFVGPEGSTKGYIFVGDAVF